MAKPLPNLSLRLCRTSIGPNSRSERESNWAPGLALGTLCGLTLFLATLVLVIKGGEHVGAHLKLLSQFYIGYTVTYAGSFVGLLYGFITGYVAGWLIAWIYNRVVALKNR